MISSKTKSTTFTVMELTHSNSPWPRDFGQLFLKKLAMLIFIHKCWLVWPLLRWDTGDEIPWLTYFIDLCFCSHISSLLFRHFERYFPKINQNHCCCSSDFRHFMKALLGKITLPSLKRITIETFLSNEKLKGR